MTRGAKRESINERARECACLILALFAFGCAAGSRPPDAAQPSGNTPGYPVTLAASEARTASALEAWRAFAQAQGISDASAPELQSVTSTVRTIAPLISNSSPLVLRLPRVGAGEAEPTEEQTHEALRRFIESARAILGVDPADVSLIGVEETNNTGAKRARYRQKPFLYSLSGGYGDVEIIFTSDGRVIEISSTAIPEVEPLRRALARVRPRVTAEGARQRVTGQTFTLTDDANSNPQTTITIASDDTVTVRELVIYPIVRAGEPSVLELHLAWEIAVSRANSPNTLIYLDAVRDGEAEVIAIVVDRNN